MKILDLYKSILKAASLEADAGGYISMVMGESKPVLVGGKRLVLPQPEQLSNPDWSERVAFHPLVENILRGESEVLTKFRQVLNLRLNYVLGVVFYEMVLLSASPAEHAKLTPDQGAFLSRVKDSDERTVKDLKKILDAMPLNQTQKSFVNIFLKRGGNIGDRRYSRVGVVSFPLYQELTRPNYDGSVFGVKLRVKDRASFTALLEYIMPDIADVNNYHRGSDSKIAPFLDSLMKAFVAVASPLNDLIEMFGSVFDEPEKLVFESAWLESFENLDSYSVEIRTIPALDGNQGTSTKAPTVTSSAATAETTTAAVPVTQQAQQPAVQKPWEPPVVQQPMVQQQWQQGHLMQPMAQQQVQPGIVKTERGVDFESVLRSNPALAMSVSNFGMQQMPYQMQQMPQAPRWASGGGAFNNQQQMQMQPQYMGAPVQSGRLI